MQTRAAQDATAADERVVDVEVSGATTATTGLSFAR